MNTEKLDAAIAALGDLIIPTDEPFLGHVRDVTLAAFKALRADGVTGWPKKDEVDVGPDHVRLTAEDIRTEGDEFKLLHEGDAAWAAIGHANVLGRRYGDSHMVKNGVYRRKKPAAETSDEQLIELARKHISEARAKDPEMYEGSRFDEDDLISLGKHLTKQPAAEISAEEWRQRAEKVEKERDEAHEATQLREKLRQAEAENDGRRRALLDVGEDRRNEWLRAEAAEAKVEAAVEDFAKAAAANLERLQLEVERANRAEAKVAEQTKTLADWDRVRTDRDCAYVNLLRGNFALTKDDAKAWLGTDYWDLEKKADEQAAEIERLKEIESELRVSLEALDESFGELADVLKCSALDVVEQVKLLKAKSLLREHLDANKSGAFPEGFEKAKREYLASKLGRPRSGETDAAIALAEEALKLEAPKPQPLQCCNCDETVPPARLFCEECYREQQPQCASVDVEKTVSEVGGVTYVGTCAVNYGVKNDGLADRLRWAIRSALSPCTHAQEIERLRAQLKQTKEAALTAMAAVAELAAKS